MPIKFSCPHCNRRLAVPTKRANTQATCPQCQKKMTVPGRPGSREPNPPAQVSTTEPQQNPYSEFEVFDLPPNQATKTAHQQKIARTRKIESQPINPTALAVPRHVLYLQGGLLLVLAVAAFALGLLVGQQGGLQDDQGAAL